MTRYLLILAGVAGALALGACGGKDANNSPTPGSGQDKAFDGALKFSKCMRQHGINLPDPQREGPGKIRLGGPGKFGGPGRGPDDPKLKVAQSACEKYLNAGGGRPVDAATRAKMQDAFVAYAGCMRGHGINMPDPKSGSGGIGFRVQSGKGTGGPTGPGPDSPVFRAADKACHRFLAGIEKAGPMQGQSK
jgi:hypothetical protein